MSWADKTTRGKNAVVLAKGAAAFFACDAKNREKANFLLDRCCFCLSPGLGKESNAIAVLQLNRTVSSSKKGANPVVGQPPFFVRQKANSFTASVPSKAAFFIKKQSCWILFVFRAGFSSFAVFAFIYRLAIPASPYLPRAPPLLKSRFTQDFRI